MFNLFKSRASKEPLSQEVLAKFEHARALAQQGQLVDAAAICGEILGLQPDHVDALMLSAEIAARGRNLEQAIQLYSNVTRLQPKYGMAYYKRGNLLKDSGQLEASLASYDMAIAVDPGHANAFCNRGAVLEGLERLGEALGSYEQALALNPADAFAHCNRGTLLRRMGRTDEALGSFAKAIAANPHYAEAHFNQGTLLKELHRFEESLASYGKAIEFAPGFPLAYFRRGALLQEMKQPAAALASYDKAIELAPGFAEAYGYRGTLLQEMKQSDAALASYDKAIELAPHFAEAYYNRGVLHQHAGRSEAALADYDKTIQLVPHFAEAHSNRGALLYARKQYGAALASYDRAIELDPNYADAFLNRGILLREMGSPDAIVSLDRAIVLTPHNAEAHYARGEALVQMNRRQEAIESYDRVLALEPNFRSVLGKRRYVKMLLCDWHDLQTDIERITAGILADRPVTAPLPPTALLDQPSLHHRAARIWVREECPPDGSLGMIPKRPPRDKLRVGYFSADFRSHPVARLTAELFETHDRSRFEITAFAFGPESTDDMRKRLERAFDRFIDVRNRTDSQIAALARELGIDIAVDLGGYTEYCRPKIFALRAAPIQLGYIGYLGTTGAPYIDYLIADATIIPPHSQADFSEKILYLPCYQVNDSQRKISERMFAREELGLPPEGFVFSSFNTLYKLQPATFETWMRILDRVQGSTLLIYSDNAMAERNLLEAAERIGIAPRRLVFAKRLPLEDYLARFRAMDLFLDTWPYNAGATASDALWAGLPVLTYAGQSFASRCAASLLNAIGLPEMITASPQQYEDLAVELATDPKRLAGIRQKLSESRYTTRLFDTRSFVRHLEAAFTTIWERYQSDLPPEHVDVR
jgi:predicted O-linked N-acetylglucosamine transferase (SPINDLY family)